MVQRSNSHLINRTYHIRQITINNYPLILAVPCFYTDINHCIKQQPTNQFANLLPVGMPASRLLMPLPSDVDGCHGDCVSIGRIIQRQFSIVLSAVSRGAIFIAPFGMTYGCANYNEQVQYVVHQSPARPQLASWFVQSQILIIAAYITRTSCNLCSQLQLRVTMVPAV